MDKDVNIMCAIIELYLGDSEPDNILENNKDDITDYIYMISNMVDINAMNIINLFNRYVDKIKRCRICNHCYVSTKDNRLVCSDECRKVSQQLQNKRYLIKANAKKDDSKRDDVMAIARAGLDQQGYESRYLDRLSKELDNG